MAFLGKKIIACQLHLFEILYWHIFSSSRENIVSFIKYIFRLAFPQSWFLEGGSVSISMLVCLEMQPT